MGHAVQSKIQSKFAAKLYQTAVTKLKANQGAKIQTELQKKTSQEA